MINFKITGLDNTFLTIEKPTGKSIPLKLGEIVKAEVMDILPTGGVTLKIKGDFITAQAAVPLNKGSEAFFKVASLPADGKELKLQFMGYVEEGAQGQGAPAQAFDLKGSGLPDLMKELANGLADLKKFAASPENGKLQDLNSRILKALPQDINALPKDVRMQLQNLLQSSLKATGQSIQTRLEAFINKLPDAIKNLPVMENIKQELTVSIEKLLQTPLKSTLQDTGVALEAKLKAVASILQHMEQSDIQADKESVSSKPQTSLIDNEMAVIKKDLKAGLLQLKEILTEEGWSAVKTVSQDMMPAQRETAIRTIDGLLKDIETFQVLSKTTDSFYTFLPVAWKELRDGEVSFKKGRSDSKGSSYSCRVNLDLERFGKLSIMVMMYNREFFVSFRADNSGFQSLLDRNVSELHENFRDRGMSLKSVNVLDVNDGSFEQLEQLEASGNSINIKA
jgi:hypothetical protein